MTVRSRLETLGCIEVAARIARRHGTTLDAMLGTTRVQEAVAARREMMLLLHDTLAMSWSHIGRVFGVDHSTVMHHCKRRTTEASA